MKYGLIRFRKFRPSINRGFRLQKRAKWTYKKSSLQTKMMSSDNKHRNEAPINWGLEIQCPIKQPFTNQFVYWKWDGYSSYIRISWCLRPQNGVQIPKSLAGWLTIRPLLHPNDDWRNMVKPGGFLLKHAWATSSPCLLSKPNFWCDNPHCWNYIPVFAGLSMVSASFFLPPHTHIF